MWKQILAAALSVVTAALSAVTTAIEAVTADQYNCITTKNTADIPLLYGKGGKWRGIFQYSKFITKFKQHPINIKNYTAHPHDRPWHGARTCKVSRKYINAFLSYSAKTKYDGQTDGRTDRWGGGGAFQYFPSRAFGVAGDKKLSFCDLVKWGQGQNERYVAHLQRLYKWLAPSMCKYMCEAVWAESRTQSTTRIRHVHTHGQESYVPRSGHSPRGDNK